MDCDMTTMDDRLSGLPDDLILKILSFVDLKDAIRTSILSPRWRYVWTSIPHLSFSSEDFSRLSKLSKFATCVLSRRNNQAQLSSFNLRIRRVGGHEFTQRIMNHAFSLNVKQVNVTFLFGSYGLYFKEKFSFPLSLSGSKTLNHLILRRFSRSCDEILLKSVHEFPSLTTLHLYHITLYDDFLSMFPNLKNLTLHCCKVSGPVGFKVLRICHPRLSNLTLEKGDLWARTVNVVTPQLKNLTILRYYGGYRVYAPKLTSLLFRSPCPSTFSTDGFHCLEEALLAFHTLGDVNSPDASTIISMLQQFHNVKLLSLNADIIQLLNSSVELISRQPPLLANLESLRILPKTYCLVKHEHTRVFVSIELKNYLLSSSLKATLTEVLTEICCYATTQPSPLANGLLYMDE